MNPHGAAAASEANLRQPLALDAARLGDQIFLLL